MEEGEDELWSAVSSLGLEGDDDGEDGGDGNAGFIDKKRQRQLRRKPGE